MAGLQPRPWARKESIRSHPLSDLQSLDFTVGRNIRTEKDLYGIGGNHRTGNVDLPGFPVRKKNWEQQGWIKSSRSNYLYFPSKAWRAIWAILFHSFQILYGYLPFYRFLKNSVFLLFSSNLTNCLQFGPKNHYVLALDPKIIQGLVKILSFNEPVPKDTFLGLFTVINQEASNNVAPSNFGNQAVSNLSRTWRFRLLK